MVHNRALTECVKNCGHLEVLDYKEHFVFTQNKERIRDAGTDWLLIVTITVPVVLALMFCACYVYIYITGQYGNKLTNRRQSIKTRLSGFVHPISGRFIKKRPSLAPRPPAPPPPPRVYAGKASSFSEDNSIATKDEPLYAQVSHDAKYTNTEDQESIYVTLSEINAYDETKTKRKLPSDYNYVWFSATDTHDDTSEEGDCSEEDLYVALN